MMYKFMLPTVLFLAPVAALVGERWTSKRVPADWLVLASALILLPTVTARPYDWIVEVLRSYPQVHEAGTSLVLDEHAPDAAWISAVRAGTPSDTVIAVGRAEFLLPVLTERSLVAPPVQTGQAAPGYWELSRPNLVSLRGYPAGLVDGRTRLLQDLFADEIGEAGGPARSSQGVESTSGHRIWAGRRPRLPCLAGAAASRTGTAPRH